MTQQTADEVLMGGGGPPAWKFDDPGTTRVGTICSQPTTRQEREYVKENPGSGDLKFFPSGDPIMGIIIELATDERTSNEDDGKRTWYVEGRYLKEAFREAVKASGATKLEVGAKVSVTFTHREDPMDKRSRKYWNVVYTPAANVALMAPDPWAPPTQAQQAPAQQPAHAPPAQQAAPETSPFVQTPQGTLDTRTGQYVTTAPGVLPPSAPVNQPPVQQVPPAQAQPQPAAQAGPTPEQVAAVRASGVDPATVWPGFTS